MKVGFFGLLALIVSLWGAPSAVGQPAPRASAQTLEIIPAKVPAKCGDDDDNRQTLFDLCRDQREIFAEAKAKADLTGKTVLVSVGADWCIWCHVFEAHILGNHTSFSYDMPDGVWTMQEEGRADVNEANAIALQSFVADHFVVVNVGQEAGQSSLAVLRESAADKHFSGGIPFIYVIDRKGKFAGAIDSKVVETRKDGDIPYRGYDRVRLLRALQLMSAAASK